MTLVMVPFPARDQAPLQSHGELHDLGRGLQPQLQLTCATAQGGGGGRMKISPKKKEGCHF